MIKGLSFIQDEAQQKRKGKHDIRIRGNRTDDLTKSGPK